MIIAKRDYKFQTASPRDIQVLAFGILFFLLFLLVPVVVPENNSAFRNALRFSAATFYGKSVTDLTQDLLGFRAMVAHQNAYPILNGLKSTHLPTTFLFVAPVAFLPWTYAMMAWAFLMLLGLFCTFRFLGFNWPQAIGYGCLSILWAPVMQAFGQFTILWLLLVTLAYMLRNTKPMISGVFIGMATLIKLFPALMLAPFLLQKKWRALDGFILAVLLGFSCAFLISPESIYQYMGLRQNIQSTILQSANASLLNVGYQWFGLPGLLFAAGLLTLFLLSNRKRFVTGETQIEEPSWMVWTFLSVVLLPVVWIYSLVPLLPIVLQLLASKNRMIKYIGWASLVLPICGPAWGYEAVPFVAGTTLLIGLGMTLNKQQPALYYEKLSLKKLPPIVNALVLGSDDVEVSITRQSKRWRDRS